MNVCGIGSRSSGDRSVAAGKRGRRFRIRVVFTRSGSQIRAFGGTGSCLFSFKCDERDSGHRNHPCRGKVCGLYRSVRPGRSGSHGYLSSTDRTGNRQYDCRLQFCFRIFSDLHHTGARSYDHESVTGGIPDAVQQRRRRKNSRNRREMPGVIYRIERLSVR